MEKAIAASTISPMHTNEREDKKSTVNTDDSSTDVFHNVSHLEKVSSGITSDDNGVRVVQIEEYKQAAMALALAFAEDDVAMYFIDTPDRQHWTKEQKWNLHVQILEYATYAHILKGLVLTAGEDYGCVALWMPPGRNMDDWFTLIRSGMWRLRFGLSSEGKKRFFTEFLPLLHDTKAATLGARDDDSWYLVYLGTKKSARGQGLARKVVEKVTKMADAQGKACYLESSNAKNPAIYMRWGFEMARKIHLQRGPQNVELDIMVREPNPKIAKDKSQDKKGKAKLTDEEIKAVVEANENCRPC